MAAAAIIAVASGATAGAQTTGTTSRKPATKGKAVPAKPSPKAKSRSGVLSRRLVPDLPPPVPSRSSTSARRRSASRLSSSAGGAYGLGMDSTGRVDKSGHPARFYPSARGGKSGQARPQQSSAQRPAASSKPAESSQKDPYKGADGP
jgi:hypothetical protein